MTIISQHKLQRNHKQTVFLWNDFKIYNNNNIHLHYPSIHPPYIIYTMFCTLNIWYTQHSHLSGWSSVCLCIFLTAFSCMTNSLSLSVYLCRQCGLYASFKWISAILWNPKCPFWTHNSPLVILSEMIFVYFSSVDAS